MPAKKISAAKRKALVEEFVRLPLSRRMEIIWEALQRVRPEMVRRRAKEAERFFNSKGGAMPPRRIGKVRRIITQREEDKKSEPRNDKSILRRPPKDDSPRGRRGA